MAEPRGLVIAAPSSGSGKTLVTLGLLAGLKSRGIAVAPAKTGPDYIDPDFLSRAADAPCINLDPWAMSGEALTARASAHVASTDLLLVEGVMGLFDGAADSNGSTGDLAATLGLPVILVVDAARQSQSIAALVSGFANWREDVRIAGIVLNNVGSERHQRLLADALAPLGLHVIGALPRLTELQVPSRHLGLVMPADLERFEAFLERAQETVASHCDLDLLQSLAVPMPRGSQGQRLPPLGQRVAIASDAAFCFTYEHWLRDWREQGAELSFFSPLADEAPHRSADAVFLPGGYPELHGEALAGAVKFRQGLTEALDRQALIYGECGGFMVLGEGLTGKDGTRYRMAGLLPVETHIDQPKRVLGYRRLRQNSALPFPERLTGHEFHYSSAAPHNLPPLFEAEDATGTRLAPMGGVLGRVMGSYAHVIDVAA